MDKPQEVWDTIALTAPISGRGGKALKIFPKPDFLGTLLTGNHLKLVTPPTVGANTLRPFLVRPFHSDLCAAESFRKQAPNVFYTLGRADARIRTCTTQLWIARRAYIAS